LASVHRIIQRFCRSNVHRTWRSNNLQIYCLLLKNIHLFLYIRSTIRAGIPGQWDYKRITAQLNRVIEFEKPISRGSLPSEREELSFWYWTNDISRRSRNCTKEKITRTVEWVVWNAWIMLD
jgi:hypothetical protein